MTPMLSIAECILSSGLKPHVHFVWMARGHDPFATWCAPLLLRMARASNFTLHLYDTLAKAPAASSGDPEAGVPIQPGRFDVSKLNLKVVAASRERGAEQALRPGQVAVFACGPEKLVQDAKALAAGNMYNIHTEAFEW